MSILHLSSKRRPQRTTVSITAENVFAYPAEPSLATLSRKSSTSSLRSCISSLQSLRSSPSRHDHSPSSPASSFSSTFRLPSPQFPSLSRATSDAPPSLGANATRRTTTKPLTTTHSAAGAMSHKTLDERSSESRFEDDQTRVSAISGLSLLSSDPDDFYQRSLDHLRRDRRRLHDAAAHTQPFRRARPATLTMDGLDRRKAASDSSVVSEEPASLPARRQSAAAASLERSNIPKEWGRRGRHTNDFLRRINSEGDMQEEEDNARGHKVEIVGSTAALQEQGSPLSSRERPSRIARPGPRVKRSIDDLLDRQRRKSDDSSFDPASPKTSNLHKKSVSPDSQREIDSVKDRAVASSRLADAAKKTFRAPYSFASAFRKTEESVEGTMDSILGQLNGDVDKSPRRLERSVSAIESQSDASQKERQARNKRKESRDLLRRFARASASPAPPTPEPLKTDGLADSRAGSVDQSPVSPAKTPPRNINALRASVHGALGSEPTSPSVRSSPSISKVPTRTSSLKSLRSSKRKSTARLSHGGSSSLQTPPEDVPVASVEKSPDHVRLDERDMLPTVPEPESVGSEMPEPMRSDIENAEPESKPLFTTIVEKSNSLLQGYGLSVRDPRKQTQVQLAADSRKSEPLAGKREESEDDLEIDDDTLEIVAGLGADDEPRIRDRLLDEQRALARMARSIQQKRLGNVKERRNADEAHDCKAGCSTCFERGLAGREVPTLWDVTAATAIGAMSALLIFFAQQDAKGRWRPRPRLWWIVGTLAWLWLETTLCRRFCPHYCRVWFPSYTDMGIRGPRFPFVTAWKLVLEPTEFAWRGPYEWARAYAEPRGWGVTKRTVWWGLKMARLDWLFGPGDERLEGRWDWPWWWSYLYGAEWGVMDPYCVMCTAPRPRATGRL